jgi:hypothetical protein
MLVLAAFAATAAVVAGLAAVTQVLAERALEDAARSQAADTAELAALAVDENARRLSELVVLSATGPQALAGVRGDTAAADALLRTLRRAAAGVRVAFLVDAEGTVLSMSPLDPGVIGENYRYRDWYSGVTRRSPYLSEVYNIAAFDQPRAVTIAASVPGPDGRRLGILTVVQETAEFEPLVRRISEDGDTSLAVLDQTGHVVAGATPPAVARATVAAARRSGGAERRLGSGMEGRFLAAARLPFSNWVVLADIPASRALADLPRLRDTATVIAGVALLLLLALLGIYIGTARLLQERELEAERHARAFEINDSIVQRLVLAKLALELGRHGEAGAALDEAIDSGSRLITRLADRDGLTRSTAALEDEH